MRISRACLAISLLFMLPALADEEWISARGLFSLRYTSTLEPIEINRIHSWELYIETSDGTPVEAAGISISGGMPEHDHGLPTAPRVSEELGEGRYRLDGMRFHMAGRWEVAVTITAYGKTDVVTIDLEL